ncbi:STAS domain-containing protein [Streptomyces sp. NPDC005012]|uniref:STAS domain-containing protein n=1 Tax=Streptomyces sp. NPDC005012 TaxID=3154558 RepID=UPI0033A767E4
MNPIVTTDGTRARITPRGEIDHDSLPPLTSAARALPPHVTELQWDMHHTTFMDIAGLHLLFDSTPHHPGLRTTVVNLHPQPLRLLLLAAETDPVSFDLTRLMPDTPSGITPWTGHPCP